MPNVTVYQNYRVRLILTVWWSFHLLFFGSTALGLDICKIITIFLIILYIYIKQAMNLRISTKDSTNLQFYAPYYIEFIPKI